MEAAAVQFAAAVDVLDVRLLELDPNVFQVQLGSIGKLDAFNAAGRLVKKRFHMYDVVATCHQQ